MHEHVVVIDGRFYHTVADSFCNNLLCLFNGLEGELLHNIPDRNFTVSDIDFLKAELNNGVLESMDQSHVFVGCEDLSVLLNQLSEFFHFTLLDAVYNLEVRC